MQLANVKIGQKVRVVGSSLFDGSVVGKSGVVHEVDGDYIYVNFDDGDSDHGYAGDLKLLSEPHPPATSVKEAIADVEAALAVLKALVG